MTTKSMFDEAVGYVSPDYLDRFDAGFERDAILALRRERRSKLFAPDGSKYRDAVQTVKGFQEICRLPLSLSVEEQRRTNWANVDSLREFLDADDLSVTVEGYPAPWRYYAQPCGG